MRIIIIAIVVALSACVDGEHLGSAQQAAACLNCGDDDTDGGGGGAEQMISPTAPQALPSSVPVGQYEQAGCAYVDANYQERTEVRTSCAIRYNPGNYETRCCVVVGITAVFGWEAGCCTTSTPYGGSPTTACSATNNLVLI
jgi:hypothetical protein